jgi:hypothetical protein
MSDDTHNEPTEKSWLDRFMKAIGMSLRDST